jgi:uncharacterized oligopeptide transporter (OPT) family protein
MAGNAILSVNLSFDVTVPLLVQLLGFFKLLRLSPLAIGIGIYLPTDATQPVVLGAVIGWLYNRAMAARPNANMAARFGVLLASD